MDFTGGNKESVLREFIAEFREHLQQLEPLILKLERESGNADVLNEIFRPVHSLKSASAALDFTAINAFTHTLETLLDRLRKGMRAVDGNVIDTLLTCADVLRTFIDDVALGGDGSAVNAAGALEAVRRLTESTPQAAPRAEESSGSENQGIFLAAAQQHLRTIARAVGQMRDGDSGASVTDQLFRAFHSLKASAGFMGYKGFARLAAAAEDVLSAIKKENIPIQDEVISCLAQVRDAVAELLTAVREQGSDGCDLTGVMLQIEALQQRKCLAGTVEKKGARGDAAAGVPLAENTVRVGMHKLDNLVNVMGELIVNQSRFDLLEHRISLLEHSDAAELAQEIKSTNAAMVRLVGEIYRTVMDIRMVSVGTIFGRFPRVIREIARRRGKDIEFATAGDETQIDKNILDELSDPLSHLIRNAADHGIETPQERAAAGKPPRGNVYLRASHENGKATIEVQDDGRGIDVAAVRSKAVANGLFTAEQAAAMSDTEMINVIFLPGFSTAGEVTDISGRGVGMDVVKTNVERLKGKIRVTSVPGKGTRMVMEVPLTMAIMEALMVQTSGELFALPLFSIHSITEVFQSEIKTVRGREVMGLHGESIGVVRLDALLGLPRNSRRKEKMYVVVIEGKGSEGTERIGFIVDALREKQKVVVKPLDAGLASSSALSGVTILGDGRVALILDPAELVSLSLASV